MAKKQPKKVELAVAFDTETTGLIENVTVKDRMLPEIIDFYACLFDVSNGEVKEEIDLLIKPRNKIPEEITKITNITNDMVENSPPFPAVAPGVKKFLEEAPAVIAHNLPYDMEVIDIEMKRINQSVTWPRRICTIEQTMHLRGSRLSLSVLHEMLFGELFADAHRAKSDVMATVRCFVELRKRGEV